MPDSTEHPALPYFVATLTDEDGQTWTITLTGAIMVACTERYADDHTTIWVYTFKAYYLTRTGPT